MQNRKQTDPKKIRRGSEDSSSFYKQHQNQLILALLMIAMGIMVAMVHWPLLDARALCYDDDQYITVNPLVQNPSWDGVVRFFKEVQNPSTVKGYYQPLTMVSLMLDTVMGGSPDNLRVYHQTSLIWHIFNTCLVSILLYLLFGNLWTAVLAGLLFGAHPLVVETIPWGGERKTLLAAFFTLVSLVNYVIFIKRGKKGCYWVAWGAYLLAVLSKPTSTTLPLLLILLDFWPLNRLNLKTVQEKLPFFILGACSAMVTYLSQGASGGLTLPDQYPALHIPLTICHNIIFYLSKIIWPVNLSSQYPFPEPFNLSNPVIWGSVAGTIILLSLLVFSLRWTRSLLACWLFFFLAILPTLGIIGFTSAIAADKYAYLPITGFLLVLGYFLNQLWGQVHKYRGVSLNRMGIVLLICLLFLAEAKASRNYQVYWQDSETLFRHMLSLAPESHYLHSDLGLILLNAGKLEEAIANFKEAVRLQPDNSQAHYYLGTAFMEQGANNEAIAAYQEALRYNPRNSQAYNNLGVIYAGQGRVAEAIASFKEAIQTNSNNAEAYFNLGTTFFRLGKPREAMDQLQQAVELNPNNSSAYNYLGLAQASQGELEKAIESFQASLTINPEDPNIHLLLGRALEENGQTQEAISEYQAALSGQPDLSEAQEGLRRLSPRP